MTTVFDGTFCAPIALRTIWRTVEIFTNAVTLMNEKRKERDERERDDEDYRPPEEIVAGRAMHRQPLSVFPADAREHVRELQRRLLDFLRHFATRASRRAS